MKRNKFPENLAAWTLTAAIAAAAAIAALAPPLADAAVAVESAGPAPGLETKRSQPRSSATNRTSP